MLKSGKSQVKIAPPLHHRKGDDLETELIEIAVKIRIQLYIIIFLLGLIAGFIIIKK